MTGDRRGATGVACLRCKREILELRLPEKDRERLAEKGVR